jgi:hypothetical protein
MDRKIIRAYLWQKIIRMVFWPANPKEKDNWVQQFLKNISNFWEIDPHYHNVRKNVNHHQFNIKHTGYYIEMEIEIDDIEKFSIRFLGNENTLMWTHDVDCQYYSFPTEYILNEYSKEKEAIKFIENEDVAEVIDGLLIHPAAHQHIESPINNHDIRFGGGISNPFLFLFHLRYQLCPDNDRRKNEKNRLTDLFYWAIKNKKNIPINELMKIPK